MFQWEPSLHQLRAFKTTADETNITKAADILHRSQSAISQSIASLEKTLGVVLFQRRSSGSFLTREGEVLFYRVGRFLERIETALTTAVETSRSMRETAKMPLTRNVTIAQITALITIDNHDSYSSSARTLGVTRPSLNRHAHDIENILGCSLFQQTSKGKTTNSVGSALARQFRLAMSELNSAQMELISLTGEEHGTIFIGILPLGASLLVSQTLGKLSISYPKLKIQIVESPFEALHSWLLDGKIDVIIGTLRSADISHDLDQVPLFNDPYCLVVRADHPLTKVLSIKEFDLCLYEWILPRQGTPRRTATEALFRSFDKRPHTIVETSSMGLTRDLLLNGNRVTLLSRDQIIFEEQLGFLSTLDYKLPEADRNIGSITRRDWQPTKLQQYFFETLSALALQQTETLKQSLSNFRQFI